MRSCLRSMAPLATLAALVAAWQFVVTRWSISPLLLPLPDVVFSRLLMGLANGEILVHLAATLASAAAGYLAGSAAAIAVAVSLAETPLLERALYPLVLGFQAIPKVAIAPLIFIWAGYGTLSEVILVALIAFFPVFVNTFNGWRSVDRNLVDLYRSVSASRWHVILNVKLPSCAGVIFAGLEIGVTFALIGCVVMEFINGQRGAGFLIENSASTLDTPLAIATMISLGIAGLMAVGLVRALHRAVVFWDRPTSLGVASAAAAGAL